MKGDLEKHSCWIAKSFKIVKSWKCKQWRFLGKWSASNGWLVATTFWARWRFYLTSYIYLTYQKAQVSLHLLLPFAVFVYTLFLFLRNASVFCIWKSSKQHLLFCPLLCWFICFPTSTHLNNTHNSSVVKSLNLNAYSMEN